MTATTARRDVGLRLAVIFNPSRSSNDLQQTIAALETELDLAPSLWLSAVEGEFGASAARSAVAAGVDLVLVAGGDGTVRAVGGALAGSGVPLGIIPRGTGNLLARSLGIPLGSERDAALLAVAGTDRAVDVIWLTATSPNGSERTEASFVLSGVGVDAAMIAFTREELKRWIGWLAYVEGIVRALPQSRPFPVRISIDGRPPRQLRAASVFIANLVDLPGGVAVAPHAEIDDGLLDVIVLRTRRLIDWLFIWRRFSFENPVLSRTSRGRKIARALAGRNRRHVVYGRGHSVSMEILSGTEEFQIDGDSQGHVTRVSATVQRRAVLIRVPHGDESESLLD